MIKNRGIHWVLAAVAAIASSVVQSGSVATIAFVNPPSTINVPSSGGFPAIAYQIQAVTGSVVGANAGELTVKVDAGPTMRWAGGGGPAWSCPPPAQPTPAPPGVPVDCVYLPVATALQTLPLLDVRFVPEYLDVEGVTAGITAPLTNSTPPVTATTMVTGFVDMGVQLQSSLPTNVAAGQTVMLPLRISNGSQIPARNVSLQGMVDGALTLGPSAFASVPAGIICTSEPGVGSTTFTCNFLGGIPSPGRFLGVQNINIEMTAAAGFASGTVSANVTSLEPDSGPLPNSLTPQTINVVAAQADIGVTVTDSVDPVVVGANYEYAITVQNVGAAGFGSPLAISIVPGGGVVIDSMVAAGGMVCSPAAANYACSASSTSIPPGSNFVLRALTHIAPGASGTGTLTASITPSVDTNPANDSATQSTQITPAAAPADIAVTLTDSADPVTPGQNFEYAVRLQNIGGLDFGGALALTLTPASGLIIDSVTPAGGLACSPGTGSYTCSGSATVTASNSLVFRVLVHTPPGAPAGVVSLTAAVPPAIDGNQLNNSATENTQVKPAGQPQTPRLAIKKTVSSAIVPTGSSFEYQIAVSNISSQSLNQIVVNDDLASLLTYQSVDGDGFDCNFASSRLTCVLQNIDSGDTRIIRLRVRAPTQEVDVFNTAQLSGGGLVFPLTSTVTTQVRGILGTDLSVSLSDTLDPVTPGAAFTYHGKARNLSDVEAVDVRLNVQLPSGVSIVAVRGGAFSCNNANPVLCTLARLAARADQDFDIDVRAANNISGSLSATASIQSATPDIDPSNNQVRETTSVGNGTGGGNGNADLSVQATFAPATISLSDIATLQLLLLNNGPSDATQAGVKVVYDPAQFDVLSASGAVGECVLSSGQIKCTVNSLPVTRQVAFTAQVRARVAGPLQVTANTFADQFDPVATNNQVVRTIAAQTAPLGADLQLTLRDSADPVALDTTFDYVATVTNLGPGTANAVSLRLNLPAGLTFVSAGGGGFTCPIVNPVLCTSAPMAAASTAVITLRVKASGQVGDLALDGLVSTTSADSNLANNAAREATRVGSPTDANRIAQIIGTLNDQIARDATPMAAAVCAAQTGDLRVPCDAIINTALSRQDAQLIQDLRAIYPDETLGQSLALREAASTQFANVDSRLSELRSGGGGFSVGGLNLSAGRSGLAASALRLRANDEEKDQSGDADWRSPWGFFINGTLSFGGEDLGSGARRVVSDFNSYGLTAGVDYRISSRAVVGGALGYARFDSDLIDAGSLKTRGITFTGYGSFYPTENFYLDARLSLARGSFDQRRRILFAGGIVDATALGNTDTGQTALAFGAGYHLPVGAWTVTPNASLRLVKDHIDGFSETGAGALNATFERQSWQTTQYTFGLQASRAFSLQTGVLSPQADLSFSHESGGNTDLVRARLAGSPASFSIVPRVLDRDFGNIGLGAVYLLSNGKQLYLNYRRLFGLTGFDRGTVNLGGRFEF
jgi:outer membrane autotransporter protein/uncharacterized repeat protein (TIGR01451 family)